MQLFPDLGDDDDDPGSSGSASQVLGGHLLADPFADTFLVGSTVNGDLFQWTVVTSDDGVARGEAADSREYGHHLPGLRLAVSSFLPTLPGAATCADVCSCCGLWTVVGTASGHVQVRCASPTAVTTRCALPSRRWAWRPHTSQLCMAAPTYTRAVARYLYTEATAAVPGGPGRRVGRVCEAARPRPWRRALCRRRAGTNGYWGRAPPVACASA